MDDLKVMRILVIGKNGQVGSSLIAETKKNNIDCYPVDRNDLNITDEAAVNLFFKKNNRFDFIINTAAYTSVDGAEDDAATADAVNCTAVKYLAIAAKKYQIPMIHLSTDYVFDGQKNTGYDEKDQFNPQNVYGKTKLYGEYVLQETWAKHIILRVSWVFSSYGKNFVKTISELSEKKEVISVVCDQFGSPTSAESIAAVIITVCQKLYKEKDTEAYWGTYHYSDFPVTNWHQLAEYVVRLKKNNCNVILKRVCAIETKDYPAKAERPKNSILNTRKINEIFGVEQRLWMRGVEETIKQLTNEPNVDSI